MKITEKELYNLIGKTNIQTHLFDLASDDIALSFKALQQVVGLYSMTKRQDCMIVIIGFILHKIKTSKQVQNILQYLRHLSNFAISEHLLRIISKDKEIFQQRLFMDDFVRYISFNSFDYNEEEANRIKKSIEDADWGIKTKNKFLELFNDHHGRSSKEEHR